VLVVADALRLPLLAGCVNLAVTSPPYWGLRDYGITPRVWGPLDCPHVWGSTVAVNATNHTDKRRWNHTRNGRNEEQPTEKRVAWSRTVVNQGAFCGLCGAWCGDLGLEPTPELYVEHIVDVFRELRRVLKDDGTVWLNLGDCYATGAGKVGEHPGGGEQGERWKGYKGDRNGHEGKHGYRIGPQTQPNRLPLPGLKAKDLVGIPWRVAFALQADGWYLRSDVIWSKPNPMPESVTDRPTKAHEYLFLLAKSERYYYDADAIAEPLMTNERENYPARAHIIGRGGLESLEQGATPHQRSSGGFPPKLRAKERLDRDQIGAPSQMRSLVSDEGDRYMSGRVRAKHNAEHGIPNTRNKRSVWTVATMPYSGAHFATFPEALVEPCILAGCPVGGLVCDPFVGSGTVGAVAERLGRRWVGTDLAYQPLAQARTAQRGIRW
jgi:DNA modification methylase